TACQVICRKVCFVFKLVILCGRVAGRTSLQTRNRVASQLPGAGWTPLGRRRTDAIGRSCSGGSPGAAGAILISYLFFIFFISDSVHKGMRSDAQPVSWRLRNVVCLPLHHYCLRFFFGDFGAARPGVALALERRLFDLLRWRRSGILSGALWTTAPAGTLALNVISMGVPGRFMSVASKRRLAVSILFKGRFDLFRLVFEDVVVGGSVQRLHSRRNYPPALLEDVGEFVRNQLLPAGGVGIVAPGAKVDVPAGGEGVGFHVARCLSG